MSNKIKRSSYLQGYTQLITDATIGVTDLVETMHKRVVHPPLLPSTRIQHLITDLAGIAYTNIKWSTRLIGRSIDIILGQLTNILGEVQTTKEKETIRSVINGLAGDYLEETKNALQISMQFRYKSKVVALDSKSIKEAYPTINGKILLMVHGSCMNDLHWTRKEHDHGAALAIQLGKTPIYLHYNSGRHISLNGQNLSESLEELVSRWPVPVEELVIIAHSMGGLVSRSALHYGGQQEKKWTKHLKKIVFLGTPHHGAPLERIGNYIDNILEYIPYAKPFARLGKVRSAGITDLRYGNLVDEDWQDNDRFKLQKDRRQNIPLPKHVHCYSVAAALGKEKEALSSRIMGDGLVNVKSALGQHKDPTKTLDFKKRNTWIAYEASHSDLLTNPDVYSKIKSWLV